MQELLQTIDDLKNEKGSMRDDSDSSEYDCLDNLWWGSDPDISSVQDKEKGNEETHAVDTGDDEEAEEGACNACCGMDHTTSVTKLMTEVDPAYCRINQRLHGTRCSKCWKEFVGTKPKNEQQIQPNVINAVHYCAQQIDGDSGDSIGICSYAICGNCYRETTECGRGRKRRQR